MKVQVLNLPIVYHIGTLDASHRGGQWRQSYEGAGLSVSLCPEAWQRIARLGGNPWHECRHPDALYLNVHALDEASLSDIQAWAAEAGLIEPREMWKAWNWDEERDGWYYMLLESREEAIKNLHGIEDQDGDDLEELLAQMNEEQGPLPEGVVSLVESERIFVLTETGNQRAAGYGTDTDATDMAVMFWTEDVLRPLIPEVVGLWWNEVYEPDILSAPRGAILPSCLEEVIFAEVLPAHVSDDEDLLETMPSVRVISLGSTPAATPNHSQISRPSFPRP